MVGMLIVLSTIAAVCSLATSEPTKQASGGRITGTLLPAHVRAQAALYVMRGDDLVLLKRTAANPKDGTYCMEGLQSGKYMVLLTAAWCVAEDRDVEIAAGQTVDLGQVVLAAAGAISGRIAPAGIQAEIRAVSRDLSEGFVKEAAVMADGKTGRYIMKSLPPGIYDLRIHAEGYRDVVGVRSLVGEPGEPTAADAQAIRDVLTNYVRLGNARDFSARLKLYSQSFRDEWGNGIEYERRNAEKEEEIKRTKGQAALAVERVLTEGDRAAVICRLTVVRTDPQTGALRNRSQSFILFGLRREGDTWRLTYREPIGNADAVSPVFTTDPRVSGVEVLPGRASKGHDWQLEPIPSQ